MPSASFKGSQIRPPRYRTPTPPTEAVEPITPTFIGHAAILGVPALASDGFIKIVHPKENNTLNGIVKSRDERDTMNAFALIALATSPPAPSHQICQQASTSLANPTIGDAQVENHVSKRAKSEMLRSPGRQRAAQETGPRPATSYNAQNHSLKSDAELLLNFSQVARSGHTVHHFHRHTKSDQTSIVSSSPLKPADVTTSHQTLNGLRIDKTQGYAAQYSSFATIPRKSDENRSVKARAEEGERCSTGQGVLENTFDHTAGLPRTDARLMHCDPSPDDVRSSGSQRTSISWARGSPPPFQENTRDTESTRSPKVDDKMEPEPTPEPSSKKSMDGQHQRTVMSTSQRTLSPRPKLKSKAHEAQYLPHEMKDSSQTISGPDKIGPSRQELPSKYSASAASICGACHFNKNSSSMDNEYNATSWISCDACKSWFHFACAGFRSEREVRGVDKFRCKKCKPIHGATTFVRKSSRAHTAIDYAGLNEGVIKTSDEQPEHHYIKPIKDGIITFLPDTFARMPPELVTAEFFERSYGMKEPIVIPAVLNPRPQSLDIAMTASFLSKTADLSDNATSDNIPSEDFSFSDGGYEAVPEHEQDALDMVIPRNLTVRQVAELYGPEEKVEVIDVKSQNGESKKWNMRRWADYYESSGNKVVRNVISLEVSQSKLGRLIRRPQIVRDLDLQDSVWPAELRLKGEVPRVQFYCLMSVADCFTDFHIDFGGSSVFYHILRGKKTFLFIPPKEKHLKKYEEWCMSPAQNWTFLADQTKECYRVDLSEGDTMLIPAGWIHAVWTPEDSLVIGGNFLTRMNYGMQLKIAQLEKATGVARKFRYPHFQKLHWYAALKYLEDDPVPRSVKDLLQVGETFHRERPAHHDFDNWGDNSEPGCEKYHARYYSQSELEGLPELTRYLLRTTLIDNGSISDGITQETRNAVRKSIPRGHGEPLELVKAFALWCAWKRGNEELPSWAYPGAAPDVPDASEKLSAAAQKRMEKEAALQAPRRQSTRKQRQEQIAALVTPIAQETSLSMDQKSELGGLVSSKVPSPRPSPPVRRKASAFSEDGLDRTDVERSAKKQRTLSGPSPSSRRKIACETCRQRRRACKHKVIISVSNTSDEVLVPTVGTQEEPDGNGEESAISINPMDFRHHLSQADLAVYGSAAASREPFSDPFQSEETQTEEMIQTARLDLSLRQAKSETLIAPDDPQHPSLDTVQHLPENTDWQSRIVDVHQMDHDVSPSEVNVHHIRARTKACADCRKSKRRCIHDENGNEDPIKVKEIAIPRPAAALKRKLAKESHAQIPESRRNGSQEDEGNAHRTNIEAATLPQSEPETPSVVMSMTERPRKAAHRRSQPVDASESFGSSSSAMEVAPNSTSTPWKTSEEDIAVNETTSANIPPEFVELVERSMPENAAGEVPSLSGRHEAGMPSLCVEIKENLGDPAAEVAQASASPKSRITPDPSMNMQKSSPQRLKIDASSKVTTAVDESIIAVAVSSLTSSLISVSPQAESGAFPPAPATSSRRSSRPFKTIERYSPSSDSARRTSSSPLTSVATDEDLLSQVHDETKTSSKLAKTPTTPKVRKGIFPKIDSADEETMKLIQELQAQEHGLRRRGRD